MPWEIQYYSESVRRELEAWPVGIRAMYARIIERMEVFGPHLGMPFTRPMGDGLFELRAKGKEGIGRVFFCTVVGHIIQILHAFIKKSQQTPRRDLELARRRRREVRRENPQWYDSCLEERSHFSQGI